MQSEKARVGATILTRATFRQTTFQNLRFIVVVVSLEKARVGATICGQQPTFRQTLSTVLLIEATICGRQMALQQPLSTVIQIIEAAVSLGKVTARRQTTFRQTAFRLSTLHFRIEASKTNGTRHWKSRCQFHQHFFDQTDFAPIFF